MDFSNFSLDSFYKRDVPLKEILADSLYYPASHNDGFPIKVCNTQWSELCVNSFVYCDFAFTLEEVLDGALGTMCGYDVIARRVLSKDEYIPKECSLDLYGTPLERYGDRRFDGDPEVKHAAVWYIYKRRSYKDDSFGPEMLSLLFVIGEAFASYQQLYCWSKVSPKVIIFAAYHDMIGRTNDFESTNSALFRMIKANPECAPEWVAQGDHEYLSHALRCWHMEEIGAKTLGCIPDFKGFDNFTDVETVVCEEFPRGVWKAKDGDDVVFGVGYLSGSIVYKIIDKSLSCEDILKRMVIKVHCNPRYSCCHF